VEGGADSEILFALVLDQLDSGATPAAALGAVVSTAAAVAPSILNLLLTDGHRLAATAAGDSLFVLCRDDSVVVASEPYDDDPSWQRVPDGTMVEARPGWVSTVPL
jgi:glutamine amidotransferase